MPDQTPGSAVSSSPISATPSTDGAVVLTGGAGSTALGALVAVSTPASFVAVTTTTTVWPWSSTVSVYVSSSAPVMSTQLLPAASQRCHW